MHNIDSVWKESIIFFLINEVNYDKRFLLKSKCG